MSFARSQRDAFPACLVCGVLLPNGGSLCDRCDAPVADHATPNFNMDKAAGRRIIAKGLKFRYKDHYKKMRDSDKFPLVIDDSGPKKVDVQHWRGVRRAKRFEGYAQGSRKITEFFKKTTKSK